MTKRTILIVDDVQFFLEQERTFFNREEFILILAKNGREAYDIIKEKKPDLVFMDLYMPEMDGDACCYAIKKDPELRHIPIIMVTQGGTEEDFERCWQAGCDDIIVKPLNKMYFVAVTKRFLQITFRTVPRFTARIRIEYRLGDRESALLTDYTVNLSTGGVFIETGTLLSNDTILDISFMLPGHEGPIVCKGRVAWTNDPENRLHKELPGGMGIQFQDLDWSDMVKIRQFIMKEGLEPYW